MTAPPFAAGIRGIALDAGNTLLWIDHARLAEVVTAAGFATTPAAVRTAEIHARPRLDPLLGRTSRRESPGVFRAHIGFVLENLGVDDPAVFAAAAADAAAVWGTLWCRPPDDAHSTVTTLHDRGYRVSCLSNSNGKVDRLLAAAGLLALLDDVVDSGAVGFEKPDPRIFRLAAERLALAPHEMVYVGDLHALDVVGPRSAGMHAVLLDPLDAWAGVSAPRIRTLADLLPWLPGPR